MPLLKEHHAVFAGMEVDTKQGDNMSLNPLEWIASLFSSVDKSLDIVKEAVTDKDKQNELIARLEEMKTTVLYITELQTKTIPWIDGVHKMGRQILNLVSIVAVIVLISMGHELTQWDVLVLGGGNVAYQVIKGVGKK